jgi:hypothetical protein
MNKKFALSISFLSIFGLNSFNALAASQDECAIWICLPGGFPSGCGAAHSAMVKRLSKLKSPLPSFSSCVVASDTPGSSNMSFTYNYAAYIPQRQVCADRYYGWGDNDRCSTWKTVPRKMIKGTRCSTDYDGYSDPAYCTATYEYADVFLDGVKTGKTRYWRRSGKNIFDSFSE